MRTLICNRVYGSMWWIPGWTQPRPKPWGAKMTIRQLIARYLPALRAAAAGLLLMVAAAPIMAQPAPVSGQVLDEARRAGRTASSFPQAGEDYFKDMDNAAAFSPDEVKGRNMWLVWTCLLYTSDAADE